MGVMVSNNNVPITLRATMIQLRKSQISMNVLSVEMNAIRSVQTQSAVMSVHVRQAIL